MPRLAVVSHAAVNEPHRAPYDLLARSAGYSVDIIAPESIAVGGGRRKLCDPAPAGAAYTLHRVPIRLEDGGRFLWFGKLGSTLRSIHADYVFVEQDPGSVAMLQVALSGQQACRVAFSVENIWRDRFADAAGNLAAGRPREAVRDVAVGLLCSAGAGVTHRLACISEQGAQVFRRGGRWKKPLSVVPLGTDLERFRPMASADRRRKLGLSHKFVMGYFGRLVPEKGVHLLIDALAQLPADVSLLLDMFKNFAPGSYADSLIKRAQQLGVADRIVTIDVPHADVPEYMNCCDAVVLPSLTSDRWKEQFGRVLPEAMACGVPVIGSRSGNIPDMIGNAGLLVPEGSAEAIAGAVSRLVEDPRLREALSVAGRERVREQFSLEAQVARLRQLLQSPDSIRPSPGT